MRDSSRWRLVGVTIAGPVRTRSRHIAGMGAERGRFAAAHLRVHSPFSDSFQSVPHGIRRILARRHVRNAGVLSQR